MNKVTDKPKNPRPMSALNIRRGWVAMPYEQGDGFVVTAVMTDGGLIWPDCDVKCEACGACLGCERKMWPNADPCPKTDSGAHVLSPGEEDDRPFGRIEYAEDAG